MEAASQTFRVPIKILPFFVFPMAVPLHRLWPEHERKCHPGGRHLHIVNSVDVESGFSASVALNLAPPLRIFLFHLFICTCSFRRTPPSRSGNRSLFRRSAVPERFPDTRRTFGNGRSRARAGSGAAPAAAGCRSASSGARRSRGPSALLQSYKNNILG